MDELKIFKQIWDRSVDEPSDDIDQEKLHEIMQKKSTGPIEKLKRSLYLEIGTIILVIPLLVGIMVKLPDPYFRINTFFLISVFSGVLVYYYINLRKITLLWNKNQQNIRESLESTLVLLRFFRKNYFILNIVLFPLGIYFGYIIGFGLGSGGEKITSLLLLNNQPIVVNIVFWLAIFSIIFVLFWFFLRYYVKKLYDVHIHKLRQLHKELTENDK
jgi:hypothetical protein